MRKQRRARIEILPLAQELPMVELSSDGTVGVRGHTLKDCERTAVRLFKRQQRRLLLDTNYR